MYGSDKNVPSVGQPQRQANGGEYPNSPVDFVTALENTEKKLSGLRPLLGIGITLSSLHSAQIAAQSSDFIMIDMEHSPLSPELMTHIVHAAVAASNGSCFPIVRVPSSGVEWIKWALDSGAAGIIVPMISSAQEMEQVIDRALYPPCGQRSFGPILAAFSQPERCDTTQYLRKARQGRIAILPMIESSKGVKNVEEILSVDGVTGAFIGPFDLRLSLGLPGGLDGGEPAFTGALQTICEAGAKLGKPIGTVAMGPDLLQKRALQGMKFLITAADSTVLANSFRKDMLEARNALDGKPSNNSQQGSGVGIGGPVPNKI